MRLASAGEAPAVEIAIASGPVRTIAGRMKLHSGGTSTTFTSMARRSASSNTAMFTSVSLGRRDHQQRPIEIRSRRRTAAAPSAIEPSRAYSRRGVTASGAISVTCASQASSPSTFSSPIAPAADDHAATPAQPQAGDVERRVEHPLHAALVADSPAQLTDALLACIGLGGHPSSVAATAGRGGPASRAAGRERRRAPRAC